MKKVWVYFFISFVYFFYPFLYERYVIGNKENILKRDGKFVVRPDSGNPIETIYRLLNMLGDSFGVKKNKAGYKTLNPKIGLIWGDGLEGKVISDILDVMEKNGWAASNIVFGMGGGLLQKVNRDTQRFAFKCSAQKRNGKWENIFKSPLDQSKVSKKGRLSLVQENGVFKTVPELEYQDNDLLETVFENGRILKTYTFDEIKKRAEMGF